MALGALAHGLEADSVPNQIIGLFHGLLLKFAASAMTVMCWAIRELVDVMLVCITGYLLLHLLLSQDRHP